MIVLGLTGSIGMGKSTTADMFRSLDVPVYDADQTVHDLYQNEAVAPIGAKFSDVVKDGAINRQKLSSHVLGSDNADNMKALEAIVHPLVREKEMAFRADAAQDGEKLIVLDIPLLFETNREEAVDGVVVVTAPKVVQRKRVLARVDMSEDKFNAILERQTPDAEKRDKADFIIDTSLGLSSAKDAVSSIIQQVTSGDWKPKN